MRMRTFLFGIFSLLVAVQWTKSSPAPDPLDTININLNLEEEPGWKQKKPSRNYVALPGDYQTLRNDYEDAPESGVLREIERKPKKEKLPKPKRGHRKWSKNRTGEEQEQNTKSGTLKECWSISATATDQWCIDNCLHIPPYCPAGFCKCRAPIIGQWSSWSSWSACSQTCGSATKSRTRTCSSGGHGGCPGAAEEIIPCILHPCVPTGQWSSWSSWSSCSQTCGSATKSRTRTCPNGSNGDKQCPGPAEEIMPCILPSCEPSGSWSSWSPWSACSQTCGNATKSRTRTCFNETNGGKQCTGAAEEIIPCILFPCGSHSNTSTELPSLPRSYCQPGESCWPTETDIIHFITLIGGNQQSCLGLKKFVHFDDPDAHIRRCLPYNGIYPGSYPAPNSADLKGNYQSSNPTCNSNPFVTDSYYNDTDHMYACMTPYQFLNNRNFVKQWMAAFIVTASKTNDIIKAIKFARKHRLGISVMGTGHEINDRNAGPAPNSLLIRTTCLTDWSAHPNENIEDYDGTKWKDGYVVLGPGHTFGRNFWWNITNSEGIYALAAKVTREMVGGDVLTVGVVGWTIGGGRGWTSPMFGIGVNQVLHVDLITAEGNPMSANYTHNTDLFWAIRGGGAGFGVITSMILKLHKPKCRTKTGDITMSDCYTVWNVTYEGEYKGMNNTVPYVKYLLTKYTNWSIKLRSSWTSTLKLRYIKRTNKYQINIEGRYFAKKGEKPCTYNSFIDTFNDTRDRKGNIHKVTADKYWCEYFTGTNNGYNCTPIRYTLGRIIDSNGILNFLVNSSIQHNDFISELLNNTWQPLCEQNPYSPCAAGWIFLGDMAAIDKKTGRGVYATPSAVSNGFNSASFNIWAFDIISKKVDLTFDQKLSFIHFNLAPKLYKYSNSSYLNEAEYTMSPGQWERRFWDKEDYSKLIKIKKKYDPELYLSCRHCIGDEVVTKPL